MEKVKMDLINDDLKELFKQYPINSQDGKRLNAKVLVKYFNPYGVGTWLITEAEELDNGDYELYGYMHLTEWEYGYILLSQLQEIQNSNSASVEIDLYTNGKILKDFLSDDEINDYLEIHHD